MDVFKPQPPAVITVVHAPVCHFCDDVQAALAELAREFPMSIDRVRIDQPRGAALLHEHRAGMYPLVLLDGTFFSVGRLPRKKLRKQLEARFPAAVA